MRVAVSAVVLAVILSRVEIDELLARAAEGAPLPLVLVTVLALACFVLAALRWRLIARPLGLVMTVGTAIRAQFVAMFGGQVLPSAIGIDVIRGWAVGGHEKGVPRVVASLVADRLVALFAACLLALPSLAGLIGAPLFAAWVQPPWLAALLGPAAVAVSGGVLAAFLFGLRRAEGSAPWLTPLGVSLGMAVLVHTAVVLMASLAASAYRVDSSPGLWLSIVPASVIVSAIPISLNGWGVREATIVGLSAPFGLPAEEALLVSVTLGVANMVASLPGAVVLARGRGRGIA